MTVSSLDGTERAEAVRLALQRCELACRTLADACASASDILLSTRGSGLGACASPLMDCWYTAAAAARLLARHDDHDPRTMIMVVAVTKQITAEAAAHMPPSAPAIDGWCAAVRACNATAAAALAQLTWEDVMSPLPLALTVTQEI
jgi:hypothetical protein